MAGRVFWVTGLSGAGKTTIGEMLYEWMRKTDPNTVIFDGDALRQAFGNDLGYSYEDRFACAMRYARLCRLLSGQGVNVVCCTISMFDKVREWCRSHIGQYTEIYIEVPLHVLKQRNQKNLYHGAESGVVQNVAGVNMDVELPKAPDIVIRNDGQKSPKEMLRLLLKEIKALGQERKRCKCCKSLILTKPAFSFQNMPGIAQNFPDLASLDSDHGISLDIFQCEHCGLLQLTDSPVPYYRDVIRATAVSKEMERFRIGYFSDFVQKQGLSGKKVVEIGAGKGEYLALMRRAGVQAFGLEHCAESVEICQKEGLSVAQGYIESVDYPIADAPFDGFFIMNFLEHIPEPDTFLQGLANNLKEGAAGLIEVPNMDMILRKNLFSEFMSDHLMYFTQKTLTGLLEMNGFEVLSCEAVWHEYCLAATVRKRSRMDLSYFQEGKERIKKEVHQFLDGCLRQGKKAAVWGAGHQALSVLALTDIKDKIEFVVDSAEFKQQRYTPGTHLKIVAPEELKNGEVGAVLVMAASYSDEVAGILRESCPEFEIGILRENGVERAAVSS